MPSNLYLSYGEDVLRAFVVFKGHLPLQPDSWHCESETLETDTQADPAHTSNQSISYLHCGDTAFCQPCCLFFNY